jgi:type IV secretory pathway protease TraF
LSEPWRDLAASREYLPPDASLIKPVAALAGDRVCRLDGRITINGRLAAFAQQADKSGRVLPEWAGCKTLIEGELFLLSNAEGSFDGRYFGVTPRSALIANAVPVSGRAGK